MNKKNKYLLDLTDRYKVLFSKILEKPEIPILKSYFAKTRLDLDAVIVQKMTLNFLKRFHYYHSSP